MILDFVKLVNGSSLSLPAHGRAGARTTSSLAALFAKQKTKFGGGTPVVERFAFTTGQEARAGKNYQKSASGFSRKKVRILFRTDSKQKSPKGRFFGRMKG